MDVAFGMLYLCIKLLTVVVNANKLDKQLFSSKNAGGDQCGNKDLTDYGLPVGSISMMLATSGGDRKSNLLL